MELRTHLFCRYGELEDRGKADQVKSNLKQAGEKVKQGFKSTTAVQRDVYVFTVICAAMAAAQLIAPVAVHRMIFREGRKAELVKLTSCVALSGMSFLLLALLGAALLVLDYILNRVLALALVAGLAVVVGWLWLVLPPRMHHARRLG